MGGEIRDPVFKKPLRVQAILDAADADRLVAEALWEKREPYLVKLVEEREAKGEAKGFAEAILRLFDHHAAELEKSDLAPGPPAPRSSR